MRDLGEDVQFAVEEAGKTFRPIVVVNNATWTPPCDLVESKEMIHVVLELAGVPQDSVHVQFERGILEVTGERRVQIIAENEEIIAYHHKEIESGPFHLRMKITARIDASGITARYANGFLRISLPKDAQVVAPRVMVDIKEAK